MSDDTTTAEAEKEDTTAAEAAVISLKLKDGTVVTYDKPFEFAPEEGEDPNARFNVKYRLVRDGDGEGPWLRIHPDDAEDYFADKADNKVRLGVSLNDTLSGFPLFALVPYTLNGDQRPECNMDQLLDLTGAPIFWSVDDRKQIDSETYTAWRNAEIDEAEAKKKAEAPEPRAEELAEKGQAAEIVPDPVAEAAEPPADGVGSPPAENETTES